jgi:two-component system, OmpR family, response regulator
MAARPLRTWTENVRILVVDDDCLAAEALQRVLSLEGFAVDCASDAEKAANALATEHFDLAVFDIALPGIDGLTFLRRLRNSGSHLPVMILAARQTPAAKIEALDLGADDFVVKPFDQGELAARCRALIRRCHLHSHSQLTLGRIRIDVAGRRLFVDGAHVELTNREWLIIECLALNSGRIVTKERLQQAAVGWNKAITPNTVEVHVSRVRSKLGKAAVLRAVRGLGYRLDESG